MTSVSAPHERPLRSLAESDVHQRAGTLARMNGVLRCVGVLIGLGVFMVVLLLAVRHEERLLDARFGNVYLEYKRKVPRWLRTQRPNRDASS